jgi:hypothetical protein
MIHLYHTVVVIHLVGVQVGVAFLIKMGDDVLDWTPADVFGRTYSLGIGVDWSRYVVVAGVDWKGVFAVWARLARGVVMNWGGFVNLEGDLDLNEFGEIDIHRRIYLIGGNYGCLCLPNSSYICLLLYFWFGFDRFLAANRLIVLFIVLTVGFSDLLIVVLKVEVYFLGNVTHILIIYVGIIDICL